MTIIKCSRCGLEKENSEFYSFRPKAVCKKCLLDFQILRWTIRKKKAIELLGGKCSKCGYDKNYSALHFHHIDPSQKDHNWSMMGKRSWKRITEELKKCILVCANCHCEIHHAELDKAALANMDDYISSRQLKIPKYNSITGKCPVCDTETYGTKFCSHRCATLSFRRTSRPSYEELKKKLKTSSFVAVGKEYGVSNNAIKKWMAQYEKDKP
jgi:hypothetical protein